MIFTTFECSDPPFALIEFHCLVDGYACITLRPHFFVVISSRLERQREPLLSPLHHNISDSPSNISLVPLTSPQEIGSYFAGFPSPTHDGTTSQTVSALNPKKNGIEYLLSPERLYTRCTVDRNRSFDNLCKKSPTLTTSVPATGRASSHSSLRDSTCRPPELSCHRSVKSWMSVCDPMPTSVLLLLLLLLFVLGSEAG